MALSLKSRLFIPEMNKCLNCGKEIPEGRKFCSLSCSAKYNNRNRKTIQWSEKKKEEHRTPRVNQVCKYCGKETGYLVLPSRKETGVCRSCKEFVQNVVTFRKLGCNLSKGLEKAALEARQKILELYVEDRLSAPEIWKQYGIGYTTLRAYLQEAGGHTRTRKGGVQVGVEESRIKPRLGPQYKHGTYRTWEGKEIFYRSSYELEYAIYLDEQRIRYDVEDLRIRYFDTQKGEERIAIPDFHLLDTNEIVEIKSSWTYDEQNMKDKFAAYRKAGFISRLILDHVEQEI